MITYTPPITTLPHVTTGRQLLFDGLNPEAFAHQLWLAVSANEFVLSQSYVLFDAFVSFTLNGNEVARFPFFQGQNLNPIHIPSVKINAFATSTNSLALASGTLTATGLGSNSPIYSQPKNIIASANQIWLHVDKQRVTSSIFTIVSNRVYPGPSSNGWPSSWINGAQIKFDTNGNPLPTLLVDDGRTSLFMGNINTSGIMSFLVYHSAADALANTNALALGNSAASSDWNLRLSSESMDFSLAAYLQSSQLPIAL
jgi:hypothetical protein